MIPFDELDRALARWKARAQGGVVDSRPAPTMESAAIDATEDAYDATPMPISAEELGSIPNVASPGAGERTGEIDVAELEAYEELDDN
jgi:hypothetical protein